MPCVKQPPVYSGRKYWSHYRQVPLIMELMSSTLLLTPGGFEVHGVADLLQNSFPRLCVDDQNTLLCTSLLRTSELGSVIYRLCLFKGKQENEYSNPLLLSLMMVWYSVPGNKATDRHITIIHDTLQAVPEAHLYYWKRDVDLISHHLQPSGLGMVHRQWFEVI